MFRSTLIIIGSLTFSLSAFAMGPVPLHLIEVEAQARTAVIKKYMELSGASGDPREIYYHSVLSSVGKFGSQWGDFYFSAEILISGQEFRCETDFLRAGVNSGEFIIDRGDLNSNSECTEVPRAE